MEEWRNIPGFNGKYQASNLGNVKSLNYKHTGKERILKPGKTSKGYLFVALSKNGKVKELYVHRLVWIAFKGPIPDGMEINHLDECKTNNNLENLSLATPKENINWGTHNGRVAKTLRRKVEQHTLYGTHICTWFSTKGIEKELGYSQGNISSCCNGKRKTAYGYKWKFA